MKEQTRTAKEAKEYAAMDQKDTSNKRHTEGGGRKRLAVRLETLESQLTLSRKGRCNDITVGPRYSIRAPYRTGEGQSV